jgi:hypothetical protein
MNELDDIDGGGSDTVFRDVILLALSGFVAVVLLLLPHLHPPLEAKEAPPPGNVVIELHWPAEIDADIDLWVEAPGDRPVGYSNKGGRLFNLLRDDLGRFLDITNINYEVAYSRGVIPGEYIVNVHMYRLSPQMTAVPVTIVASIKKGPTDRLRRIATTKLVMSYAGEEKTAIRFSMDNDGLLETGSINSLFKPLRTGAK